MSSNNANKKPQKKQVKKQVHKEVQKEVPKEVRKEVRKMAAPRRPVPKRKQQQRRRSPNLVNAYIATLASPFHHPGVRLGWGNFDTTSDIGRSQLKITATTGADGTLTCAMVLGARALKSTTGGSGLSINDNNAVFYYCRENADVSCSAAWTGVPVSNASAIATSVDSLRFISAGFRVRPLVSMQANPGLFSLCHFSAPSSSQLSSLSMCSANQFAAFEQAEVSNGYSTVAATWRPQDSDDFSFLGLADSVYFPGSVSVCTLIGATPGAAYELEFVANYEYLSGFTQPISVEQQTPPVAKPTLADVGTMESIYKKVTSMIADPVSVASSVADMSAAPFAAFAAGLKDGVNDAMPHLKKRFISYTADAIRTHTRARLINLARHNEL